MTSRLYQSRQDQRVGRQTDTESVASEHSSRRQPGRRTDRRGGERGYTVIELIVVVWIIGMLSVIMLGTVNGRIEKARMARCMSDLRSIQSTAWSHSDGVSFLGPRTFWNVAWAGKKPGPYYYLPDNEDPNAGHGNDIDGFDEINPGDAPREDKDLKFLIVCQHDHRMLAKYLYIEDEGPPTIAYWGSNLDPHYDRFTHGNYYKDGEGGKGLPGGGRDKGGTS
jgi:prepilin-type N-terminal cleavage/methylation domain-containing protein